MKAFLLALAIIGTMIGVAAAPVEAATDERRVALVIGNGRYPDAPLRNPANDARAMAASLRERGFDVILRENTTKPQMEAAIIDFGEKLTEGATALFFFAGHGMQVQGRNFMVPIDAKLTSEQRVKIETLDVDIVLDQMQGARSKVNVLILDACRNNPFERRFRSASGGLAQINAPEGTLIAYATAPGRVAADGDGTNGLYTTELLKALRAPGLRVEDVFKQVRINVARASNGAQTPWEASSLVGDFYFVPPAPIAAAPSNRLELDFWNAIKNAQEPGEYRAYLTRYPKGEFADLAQMRLASIEKSRVDAVDKARAEAAENARLEMEKFRLETTEKSRLEIEKARHEAAERSRVEIEKARLAAAVIPPGATISPSPAVSSLNGTYEATVSGASWTAGDIAATIEINGTRVSGSATRASQPRPCRISGTIASDGTLAPPLRIDCDEVWDRTTRFESLSILLEGRFARSSGGQIVGETTFRSSDRRTGSVVWRTPQAHAAASIAVVAVAPQQAALPPPSYDLDGKYQTVISGVAWNGGDIWASLEIVGQRIAGLAFHGAQCPFTGRINREGTAEIRIDCPRVYSSSMLHAEAIVVELEGRFGLAGDNQGIVGETSFRSSDQRTGKAIWRRVSR